MAAGTCTFDSSSIDNHMAARTVHIMSPHSTTMAARTCTVPMTAPHMTTIVAHLESKLTSQPWAFVDVQYQ